MVGRGGSQHQNPELNKFRGFRVFKPSKQAQLTTNLPQIYNIFQKRMRARKRLDLQSRRLIFAMLLTFQELFHFINLRRKSVTPIMVNPFSSRVSLTGLLITNTFCTGSLSNSNGFISLARVLSSDMFSAI